MVAGQAWVQDIRGIAQANDYFNIFHGFLRKRDAIRVRREWQIVCYLKPWGWDKMAATLQTMFSNAFIEWKCKIWIRFHPYLFLWV